MKGESEREESGSGRDQREGGGRAPWDAHDERRSRDQMAPPQVPCECFCLHCRRTFMSDQLWLQRARGARDGFEGFWMCPTPNCSGAGFTFDIFPTDPNHPANEGWFDENEPEGHRAWELEDLEDEFEGYEEFDAADVNAEYDPDEPHYQMLDQIGEDEDDLEGEEWKYGLSPGERPKSHAPPVGEDPSTPEEEEALYNEPDRRPREIDWTDRERDEHFTDDDIPF
ncbi:MAG TPA: hypothetical protein VG269_19820 [Tepidisphaeraceae bacterium]|jgi:hypothetical protein|nr:hypothetical protein [Tepidisphaeraceae bacterium]